METGAEPTITEQQSGTADLLVHLLYTADHVLVKKLSTGIIDAAPCFRLRIDGHPAADDLLQDAVLHQWLQVRGAGLGGVHNRPARPAIWLS